MSQPTTHWVRITANGLVHDGPAIVQHIILLPDANLDYIELYDGRDTISGTLFGRIQSSTRTTNHLPLSPGVFFGRGIYVDGNDDEVQAVIVFTPLVP